MNALTLANAKSSLAFVGFLELVELGHDWPPASHHFAHGDAVALGKRVHDVVQLVRVSLSRVELALSGSSIPGGGNESGELLLVELALAFSAGVGFSPESGDRGQLLVPKVLIARELGQGFFAFLLLLIRSILFPLGVLTSSAGDQLVHDSLRQGWSLFGHLPFLLRFLSNKFKND